MTDDTTIRAGRCHCGAVRFEATLEDGLGPVWRCNCSYCRMRGAVVAATSGITILQGEEVLTAYRFNTGAARHFFCSRCGIHTHLQRRSDPSRHGVNVACLEGVSPFDFAEVPVTDGVNHPKDTGGPARRAGMLHFVPAD